MKTIRGRIILFTLLSIGVVMVSTGTGPLSFRLLNSSPSVAVAFAADPAIGVWGTRFRLDVEVRCAGSPVNGAAVTIRRLSESATGWVTVATGSTSAGGSFRFLDAPAASSQYHASTSGAGGCGAGAARTSVAVRPGISMNPAQSFATTGRVVSMRGRVDPPRPGHLVMLQAYNGRSGLWENIQSMRLSGNSTFHFRYTKFAPGYLIFRAGYPSQYGSDMWNISRAVRADWAGAVSASPTGGSAGRPSGRRCHPAYSGACLDASQPDYDCYGNRNDGPAWTDRVYLTGTADPYDLDRERNGKDDGIGCNNNPYTGRTYP